MTVHFIGAGPGAADLITLRGRDLLARCPVCLYAGSIVRAGAARALPAGARLVDTAPLSLDEIEAEYVAAHAAGQDVARLHSGDLSVWSAVAEQVRRLERHGIPYTLTPGVPAFAAAAAALGRELTIPEVAQSLVLTRVSGRASAMPAGETLAGFGAHRRHAGDPSRDARLDRVVAELTPLYGGDCPVAIVSRASWPDERVLTRHAGNDRGGARGRPDRPHGDDLRRPLARAEGFRESALYDAALPAALSRTGRSERQRQNQGDATLGTPRPAELAAGSSRAMSGWPAPARASLGCLTLDVLAALGRGRCGGLRRAGRSRRRRRRRQAELFFVGKRGGQPSTPQDAINALLIGWRASGRRVLRLKGGDPNIFGRGGDEALALAREGSRSASCPASPRPSARWPPPASRPPCAASARR